MNEQGRMPVGEWIEVKLHSSLNFKKLKCIYRSKTYAILSDENDEEFVVYAEEPWRYPIDPEQQKRDEIMDDWRRRSLDFAHDNTTSMVHVGEFLTMLFDLGFVEVEK